MDQQDESSFKTWNLDLTPDLLNQISGLFQQETQVFTGALKFGRNCSYSKGSALYNQYSVGVL